MSLPAGALTATVTVGVATDVAGLAGTITDLTVEPECCLVWAATGQAIEAVATTAPASAGSASLVILADQPGVLTSGTVAGAAQMVAIEGWPLVARWRTTIGGNTTKKHTRRFPAPTARTTVDLDLLPEHGKVPPATVTSAQTITYNGLILVDNGDGTLTLESPSGAITDNGDGTLTI